MVQKRTVLLWVGAVAVGLLSVLAFCALLGLGKGLHMHLVHSYHTHAHTRTRAHTGIRGILVAKNLNLCERSNTTAEECVIETTLTPAESGFSPSE